jgi:L-fucose isomerase-like protein
VDECAGIDALITYRLWEKLGMKGDNTLHDIRWGAHFKNDHIDGFVWVFLISGAAPAEHFKGGYTGASSERQPAMYFKLGGGTLKGVSKPGDIVWSRIYVMDDKLHCDLGTGKAVELPEEESERRWQNTTPQWPIMHAILDGVNRDQLMAQHKANHIHVVYVDENIPASRACMIKGAALQALGIEIHFCGNIK